ncbi:hypothetical protein NDU88_005203 [Pleurodeles waltl]|uniref:Uncharacterized protein n=1 Tax=Pleurodeles waltl TaxID=8319 RepID=A0AAV7VMJ2_PLEWA|nr:hypothetical protein NDU88_005203 [Pleurodeles waltl]
MQVGAAVCTANGIPRLKDRHVDSCVVIVWAYFCWRDGGGFVLASLSLTFGVVDLCGCLTFGGFRDVGHNSCGGIPRPRRCVGGLLHGGAPYVLGKEFERHSSDGEDEGISVPMRCAISFQTKQDIDVIVLNALEYKAVLAKSEFEGLV